MHLNSRSPDQQSGAVLIISLIMLLLLTMIGVSASQDSGMEEKMAGNSRDKNLAFQAAEAALDSAEQALFTAKTAGAMPTFNSTGSAGYYSSNPTGDILSTTFWTSNATISYGGTSLTGTDTTHPPLYIIQDMGCVAPCTAPTTDPHNYRITAFATGGSTAAIVILQSIYRV